MTNSAEQPTAANNLREVLLSLGDVLLVFAIFLAHGGLSVPEVNEPNYLAKARHYWDPDWCSGGPAAGDVFLESEDVHLVFYWTLGVLTRWLPLPFVAVLGRIITYGALAGGWYFLTWTLVPRRLFPVIAAGLFVALNEHAHMAGEWVVGGVEAKGLAYALIFVAAASLIRGNWCRAWLFFGGASAMHVVIGGWATVAAAIAWLLLRRDRPFIRQMIPGLTAGFALALIGILPAAASAIGSDSAISTQAAAIQVFHRLPHHLWPTKFLPRFGLRFLLMLSLFAALWYFMPGDARLKRLRKYVAGAVAITFVGLLVSLLALVNDNLAASLLRFYWFRLSDAVLAAGTALCLTFYIAAARERVAWWGGLWLVLAMGVIVAHLGTRTVQRQLDPLPPADRKYIRDKPHIAAARHAAWLDICRAAAATPGDALFLTDRTSHTFKWHAGRAEVAVWKEMPQDAASTVEWWRRMRDIHHDGKRWRNSLTDLDAAELQALGRKYGADYAVTAARPPIRGLHPDYANAYFALYDISSTPDP